MAANLITCASLDRLTHHAHILATRGDSYRNNKRKADIDNRAPPNDINQR
jgi:DNA replication protein DnaC